MNARCWRLLAVFLLPFFQLASLSAQRAEEGDSGSAPVGTFDTNPRIHWNPLLPNPPVALTEFGDFSSAPPRPDPVPPIATGLQRNVLQKLVRGAGLIFTGRVI